MPSCPWLYLANEGTTVLMVTHTMGFARNVSDRLTFMHQRRVNEMGLPDALLLGPVPIFLINVGQNPPSSRRNGTASTGDSAFIN